MRGNFESELAKRISGQRKTVSKAWVLALLSMAILASGVAAVTVVTADGQDMTKDQTQQRLNDSTSDDCTGDCDGICDAVCSDDCTCDETCECGEDCVCTDCPCCVG